MVNGEVIKTRGSAMRIAVINYDKCKPEKCGFVCGKVCPRNRAGEECIVLKKTANIDESLCIGCGICVKKCPFSAISVVNTPKQLEEKPIHRFGENGFVLFRLPFPLEGEVVGLLGENGLGKSTAIKILSGKVQPNFGENQENREWLKKLIRTFRGTELQDYLKKLKRGEVRISYKPQTIDMLSKFDFTSRELLERYGWNEEIVEQLGLKECLDRKLSQLSGGELQRVAIGVCLEKEADLYFLDEPSSYLDVSQRLKIARLIRSFAKSSSVMIVEHDLATLDFLSDRIHIFYGVPNVYGIVSKPYSVRKGINIFLSGYIREDNVKIHEPIDFLFQLKKSPSEEPCLEFSKITKNYNGFSLFVESGIIYKGEVLGIFGSNGLGKTTFAKILAGIEKPDTGTINRNVKISYKPQHIPRIEGTAKEILNNVEESIISSLSLEGVMGSNISNLSGGELQRVAIASCLGKETELYLLDEPSAHLDSIQRLAVAKLLRKICEQGKTVMVIDHDLIFLNYISDRALLFQGVPGKTGRACFYSIEKGFNEFLKDLNITFRKDKETGRPRANKPGSQRHQEQKSKGKYFLG